MAHEITVPDMGESVVEATVVKWHKQEGERVSAGDVLVELETEKVNLDVSAGVGGVLAKILKGPGEDVKVGDVLGIIENQEAAQLREEKPAETKKEEQGAEAPRPPEAPESKLKEESSVQEVTGVEAPPESVTETPPAEVKEPPAVSAPEPEAAPGPEAEAPTAARRQLREERVRMSRRRRTIAERLLAAQRQAAMLTTFNEVDMGSVLELRRRYREGFQQRHGVKLGLMSFFVKAVVGALREFPKLNAEIQGDTMVIKHYYDIGIAIDAPGGLVVPVLRDADQMSFAQIERSIAEYAEAARSGTLSLKALRGGTFTITNGGVFGSLLSTPILNPPQVGILGMHRIQERPAVRDGKVVVRPMMYLALTYDHRIVDGAEAVRFLVRVKEFIENPDRLLIEG